jgi:DNA-binding MarR family transcriptional regulator
MKATARSSPRIKPPAPKPKTAAAERRRAKPAEVDMSAVEHAIGYLVRRALLACFQSFRRLVSDSFTTAQYAVLRIVGDNAGLNQTELATALGIETPRMVLLLDELERRALLVRVASTTDRRSRSLYLTDEGQRVLRRLRRRAAAHERDMLSRLGIDDDPEALRRMLRAIAAAPGRPRS